jgi:parvulin-like peptidyl-prolyl isomerase
MSIALRFAFVIILFAGLVAHAAEKVAALVNGEAIAVAEVDAALAKVPVVGTAPSAVQLRQQRSEILNVLVDDKLVRQFLREHGPKIEPVDVERQFVALAASLKSSGKNLDDFYKEAGLNEEQVKENFLRMLQLARYVESQATPERLRAYFDANRDLFDRTTVRTSHIVIRFGRDATTAEKQKAIDKLRTVREELAAGRLEFATAAKTYSQCASGPKGGDMGYIVRKFQADEAYASAAFSLKVGDVSDVVETESGVHLIWVTDRKAGKTAKFEDVTADVRQCFEAELKQNLLAELRKRAKIEVKLSQ